MAINISVANVIHIFFVRFLINKCVSLYGLSSIRNPNVLEFSLNKVYWDSAKCGTVIVSTSPVAAPEGVKGIIDNSSALYHQLVGGVTPSDTDSDHTSPPLPNLPTTSSPLSPTPLLLRYTRSACLCTPCVKVVTVNIVQSTYAVPTYSSPGGDLEALNAHCKYCSFTHE